MSSKPTAQQPLGHQSSPAFGDQLSIATVNTTANGLQFLQPKRGYRFAPESPLIRDLIRDLVRDPIAHAPHAAPGDPPPVILDLGAGVGVLGLSAWVRSPSARVVLVEKNPALAQLARLNQQAAGATGRVICGDLREVDLPKASLILANPPFYPVGHGRVSKNSDTHASTHAISGDVYAFVDMASRHLTDDGSLWVLYPADQLADVLLAAAAVDLSVARIVTVHARHKPGAFRVWTELRQSTSSRGPTCVHSVSCWTER